MPEPTDKATLGVVAIAKNEERDIPHFLANVLPWADEIVVVDNGSSDRLLAGRRTTQEIVDGRPQGVLGTRIKRTCYRRCTD